MKKIISLFQRNYDGDRLVRNEVTPGAEWVLNGEGFATRKFDGTCCLVRNGKLYKRYEVKPGSTPPANFEPATEIDESTGKQQGWLPVGEGPEDKWHREAFEKFIPPLYPIDGTYELVGPKIQGNPEKDYLAASMIKGHYLKYHGSYQYDYELPRDFEGLKQWLSENDVEGLVWYRSTIRNVLDPNFQNCDMVKIKGKDFGLKRKKA